MTDDDIRDMLRTKATEVRVSPDAWDKIAVRLAEPERKVSQLPRRLALVGVAAAAVAGIVVLANRPVTDPPVTQATTTTTPKVHVDTEPIDEATSAWLDARVPDQLDRGVQVTTVADDGESAHVTFRGGDLETDLSLVPLRGLKGWGVLSATSDLVIINNPTYDGHDFVAEAIPAAEGQLTTTYVADGEERDGGTIHVVHEAPHLGFQVEGAQDVAVRVVLVTADGTTAIAEEPARILRDPATATGSYVALFPSTDAVGLATMQQQADDKRRTDLLDPIGVAGNALYELLPRSETSTTYEVGDLRKVDGYRGEVPYTLSDGGAGVVQLRRTADDDTRIWYVTGVTSDALEVLAYHHEGRALVIDVRSTVAGTLTLAGGDAPIDVQAGVETHISRPLGRDIQTGAPVELRLRNDRTTLAVVAELPR